MPSTEEEYVLFDAGVFIGALLTGDSRHIEARPLVKAARRGDVLACTTTGILSEVYAALTGSRPSRLMIRSRLRRLCGCWLKPPSMIRILPDGRDVALRMVELAASHQLRARRVHDARHAAAAIVAGITLVYTYNSDDWESFESNGLSIAGPISTQARLGRAK